MGSSSSRPRVPMSEQLPGSVSPSRSGSPVTGALLICAAATLWGVDGVVLTPRLSGLPVLLVVLLLHAVPFLLMQPFFYGTYRAVRRLDPGGLVTLLLVALSGGMIGTLAIVKALFLTHFDRLSVVVLLQKLQPVFAILLAAILLGERLTSRFLVWAAVALAGAYALTFGFGPPSITQSPAQLEAAVWALVAAAAFGSATVLGKRLLGYLDFKQATFARYGVTTGVALAALLASGTDPRLGSVTGGQWGLILLIGLTAGSGAIFAYYHGLAMIRASVATICELCLPLSAVVLDYLVNDSVLAPWQWVGAALLTLAITRVTLGGRSPVRRSP